MAKTFHLTVAKVGENLFDDEALSVTLPGTEGVFQVLANHEACISELTAGDIRVIGADKQAKHFPLSEKGIAEISHNQVTVLV
jgi:F-type H+-transporting ATPase subunit epsilon